MLKDLLKDYDKENVELFCSYVKSLKEKKKKNKNGIWELANEWACKKTDEWFAECYKKINATSLVFDGKHIIIQETGVGYDYVAYKNKMLIAYPESKIDVGLVYKGDEFMFKKSNGSIEYNHSLSDPFNHKDEDIIGGYVVIKNKRGEFITTLSKEEINKCRSVAKTDSIWKMWFSDMALKTVIKKAVKLHFDDVFEKMEEEDNKNYDLEKSDEGSEVFDKSVYLFEELLKSFSENEMSEEKKNAYLDKFKDSTVEERRSIYRSLKDMKGVKNENS